MARLSVVTPCYNAEVFVGSLIESVLNQGFTDWEFIFYTIFKFLI